MAITSGQGVLLPESTRKLRKERRVTVAVNSRDRNLGQFIDSNEFRWALRRPLKDIVSIELVNGSVPADLLNINTGWNTFTFGEVNAGGGPATTWLVTLIPGQYTASELATQLQTQLNGLAGRLNTYTVTYTATTRKYTITASAFVTEFTLYFRTGNPVDTVDTWTGALMSINTPGRILGFDYFDYTSSAGSITPPYRADPDMMLSKLYLHINADNSTELNRIEVGAGRKDCFHILYMDNLRDGYYNLNKDMQTALYISSPAPIARLTTLTISFRDESYRLIDLGHHDFTLMFEITYLD